MQGPSGEFVIGLITLVGGSTFFVWKIGVWVNSVNVQLTHLSESLDKHTERIDAWMQDHESRLQELENHRG